MLNSIITEDAMTLAQFFICLGAALVLGFGTALLATYKSRFTKSLLITLAILPAVAMMMIILVNGNLGIGVAVAGTFTLVHFRSAKGTGREIALVFLATAVGIALGQGFIGLAFLFFAVMALFILLLSGLRFPNAMEERKLLRITVPEDLDYEGLFDDLLAQYAKDPVLTRVRTANQGTVYELGYELSLKNGTDTKAFLDGIRCRNGNMKVVLGPAEFDTEL